MVDTNFFSEDLTEEERVLYNRQFRLEGWDQKLIKNSRVLIVGVGGLGCEIAKNLSMCGVGTLDLVDLDIIEHSNLNRQILFAGAEMGSAKALVAAERLKDINPNITINGHHSSLERLDPEIYKKADVIIGGLDSINARLNLNAQAVRFNKPLCDGGVGGYNGHVYTIYPGENACFECYPQPTAESDEMAACTVVGIPRKRIHCVFKGNMEFSEKFGRDPTPSNMEDIKFITDFANNLVKVHNFLPEYSMDKVVEIIDRHDPGIITINAIISAIQSHEVIKILHYIKGNTNLGVPFKSYMILNGMSMHTYHVEKKKNPECYQCGSNALHVTIKLSKNSKTSEITNKVVELGYHLDPDMEPIMTVLDFNDIREVDLEQTISENKLRNYELITCVGFDEGQITLTLMLEND